MSLLENIVGQVIKSSLGGQQTQQAQNNGLGGLLGGLLGGQNATQNTQSNANDLGSLLGSVLGGQMGSGNNGGLGGVLGSVLGSQLGQSKSGASAADLGSVLGSVLGAQKSSSGFNKNTLLVALLPVILSYIQKNGGLSGVLSKIQGAGLADKAQSWVNTGQSQSLDSHEVANLFGQEEIGDICRKTGASQDEVCQGLATLLPEVVDNLTPDGNLDTERAANDEIGQILANFGKNV